MLRALFIGANNAPIPNVRARFLMDDSNSIGGSLSSDAADGTHNVIYSDGNGVARATYTAGTRGGIITPKVCWSTTDFPANTCPNSTPGAAITVVASGVNLAVNTNGAITVDDTADTYSVSLVVQVVDASNQPISGSKVTGSVDIPHFYRGIYTSSNGAWSPTIYVRSGAAPNYVYAPSVTTSRQACDNEDVNRNNVVESGEDANASGTLEPFKASVTITPTSSGSDVTDLTGKAYFKLEYGQNFASWEDVIWTFTTTVEGTEGHNPPHLFSLPVPSAALTDITKDPAFKISPYNMIKDNLAFPWIVGTTAVANPGVIYPTTPTFYLCQPQQ